jgi:hypothetical protein
MKRICPPCDGECKQGRDCPADELKMFVIEKLVQIASDTKTSAMPKIKALSLLNQMASELKEKNT